MSADPPTPILLLIGPQTVKEAASIYITVTDLFTCRWRSFPAVSGISFGLCFLLLSLLLLSIAAIAVIVFVGVISPLPLRV